MPAMPVPFYDLKALTDGLRDDYHRELTAVLDSGFFIGGQAVERFEAQFAEFLNVGHVVGVANGLDALRLSLQALDIGAGDEVIVPGFTFAATWLAVVESGATPVPVDVQPDSASIDTRAIEAALSDRTRAVMPVHLYGIPADLTSIQPRLTARGIAVIHDAAQAHGARYSSGERVGALGTCTAFSFYPTKNLGALGDAGCVTTPDPELAALLRSLRSYGQGESKYDHVRLGVNSRLDPLQARFLSLHLARLEQWNGRRQEIAEKYLAALGQRARAVIRGSHGESVWHHFVVRARDRDALRTYLGDQGISTDVHYPYWFNTVPALNEHHRPDATLDASQSLARSVTSLPMGPWMRDDQVAQVADALADAPDSLFA